MRERPSKLKLHHTTGLILQMAHGKQCLNLPSLLLTAFFCCWLPSFQAKVSYPEHCGAVVPQAPSSSFALDTSSSSIYISYGSFSGGGKIFNPNAASSSSSGRFRFYARHVYRTDQQGIFHLTGSLNIEVEAGNTDPFTTVRIVRRSSWGGVTYSTSVEFDMAGFWSKTTGKVCMVGTSAFESNGTSLKLSAVFILNYPDNSNIYNSIVSGTVRSLDASGSPNHFEAISVLGYGQSNYTYTQFPKLSGMCSRAPVPKQVAGFEPRDASNYFQHLLRGQYRLVYGGDCSDANCSPTSEFLPGFMSLNSFQSTEEGKVHMDIGFTNASRGYYDKSLVPGLSLVSEGYWDSEKKALCLLACPVLREKDSSRDSYVGECTIGLTFWFPSVFTISERSPVAGRIWSVKGKSDPGYFSAIEFRSVEGHSGIIHGLKYKYTKADSMRRTCETTKAESLGDDKFPDENSIENLIFDLTLNNSKGKILRGSATPFSFGDDLFGEKAYGTPTLSVYSGVSFSDNKKSAPQTLWDISYIIKYRDHRMRNYSSLNLESSVDIAAEGVYNTETGKLCMVACKELISKEILKNGEAEGPIDCQIEINMQLSPINQGNREHSNRSFSDTRHVNGTIRSTRNKNDHLYFDPLEILSYGIYAIEAHEVDQRMDMEIAMVVTSLTLSCIFIVFQIFHVRRHLDVLPSMSITMLVVLTLGYMVPLMLNLEALFLMNRRRQSVMLWSGGWLEVNEVIVRAMTMLAFLLQCRLLQLSWAARSPKEGRKGIWAAESKVLLFCLPLYFVGAFIAWFVHTKSHKTQEENLDYSYGSSRPIRDSLISYFGLILDGFLLPQIILNIIWNSKDKALVPLFYIGTTAVRALPHLYDAYRASNYLPYFRFSYIYASHDGDYYSAAWDVIIPLVGVMFAVLICLQQRFSGNCVLPQQFRKLAGYDIVPVISL